MAELKQFTKIEQREFDVAVKDFCVKAWQLTEILPVNFSLSVLPLDDYIINGVLQAFNDVEGTVYVHNADFDKSEEIPEEEQEVGYMIMDLGMDTLGFRKVYVFCGSRIETYPKLKQALLDLSEGKEI